MFPRDCCDTIFFLFSESEEDVDETGGRCVRRTYRARLAIKCAAGGVGGSNQRGNWGVKRDENERSEMEPAPPLLKSFGEVLMKP